MSVVAAQLIAEVSVSGADKAKTDLQEVGETTTKTGGIFKSALGGALSLATGVAGQAFGFLKDQMVDSVKIAMAHQDVMAQTTQAVKSTGGAAGMTADAIDKLGDSLSKTTKFTHDTVQSGENLLLTFTGIGKDVFPATTKTMLDMAQAMSGDTKGAAIMLGKALNDPTTGLSALTRVGVTFSTQEKEQIQTMMAHNDVIGAQKVMLKELNTEFGGSAEAAGKTFAGSLQILKNNLEDVKEKIGSALLPMLSQAATFLSGTLTAAFADVQKGITYVGEVLRTVDLSGFREAWQAVQPELVMARSLFEKLVSALNPLKDAAADFDPLADAIAGLAKGGLDVLTNLMWDFSQAFMAVDKAIQGGGMSGVLSSIGTAMKQVGQVMMNLSPGVNLFEALSRHAQDLGKWFQSSVAPALKQAEPGFANLMRAIMDLLPVMVKISEIVHETFQKAFDALLPVFERMIPLVIEISGQIADGLGTAIKFLAPYVVQAVAALGQFVDEVVQRVVPIINQWISSIQQVLKIWNAVWPYLAPILKGVWDEIVGVVKIAWALVAGIIKVGLDLMTGNWSQAWKDLKDMLGGVWDGIKTYIKGGLEIINGLFGGLPGKALQWGKDMISGFISGIGQMLGGLSDMAGQIASTISNHLHFSKPEIGPLASADQWMPDMMTMLTQGMQQNLGKVKAASLSVATTIATSTQPSLIGGLAALPQGANTGPIQVTVQVPNLYLDGRLMTRGLMPHITQSIRSVTGVKY